jgi:hypothetical protein
MALELPHPPSSSATVCVALAPAPTQAPTPSSGASPVPGPVHHPLRTQWKLWAHYPKDPDWSHTGYKFMADMRTAEEAIVYTGMLPESFIGQSMLFVMRHDTFPTWEDANNVHGGAFSYKVPNKIIKRVWEELTYALIGNTISSNEQLTSSVTGITVSPKNNFFVVKIWTKTCRFQNPMDITAAVRGLNAKGCLFRKHDGGK